MARYEHWRKITNFELRSLRGRSIDNQDTPDASLAMARLVYSATKSDQDPISRISYPISPGAYSAGWLMRLRPP